MIEVIRNPCTLADRKAKTNPPLVVGMVLRGAFRSAPCLAAISTEAARSNAQHCTFAYKLAGRRDRG